MERRGEETAACVRAVLVGHHTALALLGFLLLQPYGHLLVFDPSFFAKHRYSQGASVVVTKAVGKKNENARS